MTRSDSRDLTDRECELVVLVAEGLVNKEIAVEMGISAATVKMHLQNLFRRFDVDNRIRLLRKLKYRLVPIAPDERKMEGYHG